MHWSLFGKSFPVSQYMGHPPDSTLESVILYTPPTSTARGDWFELVGALDVIIDIPKNSVVRKDLEGHGVS